MVLLTRLYLLGSPGYLMRPSSMRWRAFWDVYAASLSLGSEGFSFFGYGWRT